MTTIAWDGKTLAADRLACYGNTRRPVCKLFDCDSFIFGASGDWSEAHAVSEWLTGGANHAERPTLNEEAVVGIAVRKLDAKAYVLEGRRLYMTELIDEQFATGSGRDFARAAMALGHTAEEAVVLASRFDVYSGLGIDVLCVGPMRKTKAR